MELLNNLEGIKGEVITAVISQAIAIPFEAYNILKLSKLSQTPKIRNHHAFLNGYAPEDEGLYDDYPIG